jgi:hypothetical protein
MGHSRVETVGHMQSDAPPLVRQKRQNFKNISQDDEDNKHTVDNEGTENCIYALYTLKAQ